ncbi:MAG: hypothetical protein HKN30_08785 [Sulfitobacter sp.]|nr:hypothetical protein [Sulfitobacter sp.]
MSTLKVSYWDVPAASPSRLGFAHFCDLVRAQQLVRNAEKMPPGYSLENVRRRGFSRLKDVEKGTLGE